LLVTAHPKSPEKHKKAKISVGFVEILGVSHQILAGVEMSNLKKGSRVTPTVDLNVKPQYAWHCALSFSTDISEPIYSTLWFKLLNSQSSKTMHSSHPKSLFNIDAIILPVATDSRPFRGPPENSPFIMLAVEQSYLLWGSPFLAFSMVLVRIHLLCSSHWLGNSSFSAQFTVKNVVCFSDIFVKNSKHFHYFVSSR
jgi:hypothetical protein